MFSRVGKILISKSFAVAIIYKARKLRQPEIEQHQNINVKIKIETFLGMTFETLGRPKLCILSGSKSL